MNDKVKKLAAAAALIAMAAAVCAFVPMPASEIALAEEEAVSEIKVPSDDIYFSCADYFYSDDIELTISSADKNAEIFFTLDSTPPNSESGLKYSEPLLLEAGGRSINSYAVKACGKLPDGSFTKVFTHTYFVGRNIDKRFDTLVFSISTDPYNLYDDEYGIFTEGKLRREYIEESGDRNPEPPAPANYNIHGAESERPAYVEIFDRNGNHLSSQNIGIRAFGGYSRAMGQKSIKLFARSEYDKNNRFDVDFFGDDTSYNGMRIKDFKRVVLRNSANDNPFAFLRDEVIQACAEKTGLYDTQSTAPAAVFLNGSYYGMAWIHEVYDENYLDSKNGIDSDELSGSWQIFEGGEIWILSDEDGENSTCPDFTDMYKRYYSADFTDDKVFKAFCDEVDIENFLTYYAVQTYVFNGDWPSGNYKAYRRSGGKLENAPTADGKWRWLLFDTDFGLGLYGAKASDDTLGTILGERGNGDKSSPLLTAVLKRDDMKAKFAGIMCDLMNYAYKPENVNDTIQEVKTERQNELEWNFRLGGAQLTNTWSSLEYVENDVNNAAMFAYERPDYMYAQLEQHFGLEHEFFTLDVKNSTEAAIYVNGCNLKDTDADFSGKYYTVNKVQLSAAIKDGYEFDHWLVNGESVYSEALTIESSSRVELVTKRPEKNVPIITMADYETGADRISLFNAGDTDISLKRFFISDKPDDPYYEQLPGYILKPGETIMMYCKNYDMLDALGQFSLGFSIRPGETLTISDADGEVCRTELTDIKNREILVRDMLYRRYYNVDRADYDFSGNE